MNIASSNWRLENVEYIEMISNVYVSAYLTLEGCINSLDRMDDKVSYYRIDDMRVIQCETGKIINVLTINEAKRILKLEHL